jgi:1,4-alpha-glucan branching enzyme
MSQLIDQRLIELKHYDPHSILGLHDDADNDGKVIRLWRPGALDIYIELFGNIVEVPRIHDSGVFEIKVPKKTTYKDYRVYHHSVLLSYDPYSFPQYFGEIDSYLFSQGVHYKLYDVMGAHVTTHQGCAGVNFVVWAPNAMSVALVGDFNHWDGSYNPMRSLGGCGVWELFIPGLGENVKYKFEIRTQNNQIKVKADPYAFYAQKRPSTASVTWSLDKFEWMDQEWMDQRFARRDESLPMNTYEVHLGSWKRKNGHFMNYREIAHDLAAYCNELGFTHVELMPISEYPLDESWGYQVTGYYATTSRYGTPEDFQYFVDYMHRNGLAVILDWVPAHFPSDDFALASFDGTCLYEHHDDKQGFHPHWNTFIFNYGRKEISNFLIANALFWFDKMHIDGLRVDAVASMLYLDYGREEGQWIPNKYGGKENIEAIEFLRHCNSVVHKEFPGVVMIAEESTSFLGITHPAENNGMGFDIKWNMGWMNDTLKFFEVDPMFRTHHHNQLTFGLLYAFSERFALVFSHDEVVHGKRSLISKMPGDNWQKFANLRLLYSYMVCQPGKNLLFMGGEFGQWKEWNCNEELDWILRVFAPHEGVRNMVKELNHIYLENGPLWEKDFDHTGFEWVSLEDKQNCVIAYKRKGYSKEIVCVHNFTPMYHGEYFIGLQNISSMREIFNSDEERYGGSGKNNHHIDTSPYGFKISMAPLATMIFEIT